eukprot:g1232.t1
MDCDDDWDMLGEDGNLNQADDDGWGVDSEMFTTKLSGVSATLRKKAAEMARQIRKDKSSSRLPFIAPAAPVVASDKKEVAVSSAEDALKILAAQQKKAKSTTSSTPVTAPVAPQSETPKMSTEADERAALRGLRVQLNRVRTLLRKFGEPSPVQCGRFLKRLTAGLIKTLRYPRPDVRGPVSKLFLECSWEIRRNRSVRGSRPPSGKKLEHLLVRLVSFFAKRFGERGPSVVPKKTPLRGGSRRRDPVRRKHKPTGAEDSQNKDARGRQRRFRGSKDSKRETTTEETGSRKTNGKSRSDSWQKKKGGNDRRRNKPSERPPTHGGKHGGQGKNRRRGGAAGSGGRDSGSTARSGRK